MSSRAKKPQKVAEKKRGSEKQPTPAKTEVVQTKREVTRPKGPAPHALVSSRRGGEMVEREGRGFSIGEVEGAELSPAKARGWHLSLDGRRRTVLEGNVQALKKWFVPPTVAAKPKPAKPEPHREAKKEEPKKRAPRKKAAK